VRRQDDDVADGIERAHVRMEPGEPDACSDVACARQLFERDPVRHCTDQHQLPLPLERAQLPQCCQQIGMAFFAG